MTFVLVAALLLAPYMAPAHQDCEPFVVTFYSAERYPGWTADSRTTTWGALNRGENLVAVDPNVIPLGSTVWVEGWGTATAHDTGSKVKGRRVDWLLATTDEALREGVQERMVCVSPPG